MESYFKLFHLRIFFQPVFLQKSEFIFENASIFNYFIGFHKILSSPYVNLDDVVLLLAENAEILVNEFIVIKNCQRIAVIRINEKKWLPLLSLIRLAFSFVFLLFVEILWHFVALYQKSLFLSPYFKQIPLVVGQCQGTNYSTLCWVSMDSQVSLWTTTTRILEVPSLPPPFLILKKHARIFSSSPRTSEHIPNIFSGNYNSHSLEQKTITL